MGQPPSNCFWIPVISKLGSTSLSVSMRSPSLLNHSMAPRKSWMASTGAPSRFSAFAIALLRKKHRFQHPSLERYQKGLRSKYLEYLGPDRQQVAEEFLICNV